MKKHCENNGNKRERELRKQKAVNKRFNDPLKIFIQRKYVKIYNEYAELYKRMETESPSRKDLCKTKTFKKWLAENDERVQTMTLFTPKIILEHIASAPSQPSTVSTNNEALKAEADVLTQAIHETIPGGVADMPLLSAQAPAVHNIDEASEDEESVLQALQEILSEEAVDMSSAAFDLNVEMVNEILSELQENQNLKDMLQQAGDNMGQDEGISLSYFDETEIDIQPFNHDIEVAAYDF